MIDTIGMGVLIVEHTNKRYQAMKEKLSARNGKLNAFILAPSSILSYLYYLIMILFYRKFSVLSLPKSLGVIQTSKLDIVSSSPIDFFSR